MKKLVLSICFLAASATSIAQTSDFKKDVMTYVNVTGSTAVLEATLEPVIEQIPEAKREEFKKELKAKMPSFEQKTAELMMKYYTHEEIKKMIEFYNSPVGKKIQKVAPEITKESMKIGQEWAMNELTEILMKYLQ